MTNFLKFFFFAAFTLSMVACGNDDSGDGGDTTTAPTLTVTIQADTVDANSLIILGVSGQSTESPLNAVEFIDESGSRIDAGRLTIDGSAATSGAPLLIGADKDMFTWAVTIEPHAMDNGTYDVILTDEEGTQAKETFTIFVNNATPLDSMLTGVLLNQAGPSGTGGLDLSNGASTGSASPDADMRDVGIDCTINPAMMENWRAQIGSVNGADMRKVDETKVEAAFFSVANSKEMVQNAYDTGIVLADGVSEAPDCSTTPVTDVSDVIMAGDMFVVVSNGVNYLIRIQSVSAVGGSNSDSYTIDIKY